MTSTMTRCADWQTLNTVFGLRRFPLPAQGHKAEELAKETQKPVTHLINVPFKWNMAFGVGPFNAYQSTLNIQPVIPISVTKDWRIPFRPDCLGQELGVGISTTLSFCSLEAI